MVRGGGSHGGGGAGASSSSSNRAGNSSARGGGATTTTTTTTTPTTGGSRPGTSGGGSHAPASTTTTTSTSNRATARATDRTAAADARATARAARTSAKTDARAARTSAKSAARAAARTTTATTATIPQTQGTHGGGSHAVRNNGGTNGHNDRQSTPSRGGEGGGGFFGRSSQPVRQRDLEEPLIPTRPPPARGFRDSNNNNWSQQREQDGDNCSWLCTCLGCICAWLCGCFAFACCCCGGGGGERRSRVNSRSSDNIDDDEVDSEGNTNCCTSWFCGCLAIVGGCCKSLLVTHPSTIPILCMTAFLLAGSIVLSGQSETWTLNAGESRQVVPGWLTRLVDIQVTSPRHDGSVDVSVYALPKKKCPNLTGPIVSTYYEHPMSFGPLDYQYDFFYLNKGSKAAASFTQTQGFSDVYLLRGQDALSTLENHHDEDEWAALLRNARKKWEVDMDSSELGDNIGYFQADRNDVYTLLYDNPSHSSNGQLLVDLWSDLTTYNLKGYSPACKDLAFQRCRPIETEFAKCIIVDTQKNGVDNDTTIKIVGNRDWSVIVLISLLPGFLAVVWKVITCCGISSHQSSSSWQPVASDEEIHETPPPTAPRQPTAPPSSDDLNLPTALAVPIPEKQ